MTDILDLATRWGLTDRFWLRGEAPPALVSFDAELGAWSVFGHPEAVDVLSRDDVFSADSSGLFELDEETARYIEGDLTQMSGPDHLHLRDQVAAAFTAPAMDRLSGSIVAVTDRLLDAVGNRARFDLLGDVVCEVSGTVFSELLGIPTADRVYFDLINATMDQEAQLTTGDQQQGGTGDYFEGLTTPLQPLRDMLGTHIDDRRRTGRDDLLGLLATARRRDGELLTRDQATNCVNGILGAGHLSTPMLIGNTVLCLDAFADQRRAVFEDRTLVATAFEETMRFLTPANATYRATLTDTVIAGVPVGANQLVRVWLGAANRDARVFHEPDRFDVTRAHNPHLGFGHGSHFCLGRRMITLESELVFNRIADRYPALRVDPDTPPVFFGSPDFTGVKSLTVRTD